MRSGTIMRTTFATLAALLVLGCKAHYHGVPLPGGVLNTLTLDNASGEHALVKVVGPSPHTIEVRAGGRRTVAVAAGEYFLLVRYGQDARAYRYSRGDRFRVEQTATAYSVVTITLYVVPNGNYGSQPSSAQLRGDVRSPLRDQRRRGAGAAAITPRRRDGDRSAHARYARARGRPPGPRDPARSPADHPDRLHE
jgi:hypothetical protein